MPAQDGIVFGELMGCQERTMSSERPARKRTRSPTHSHARRRRRRGAAGGSMTPIAGPRGGVGGQAGATLGGGGGAGGASTRVGGLNTSGTVPGPDSNGTAIGSVFPVTPPALRSPLAIAAAL